MILNLFQSYLLYDNLNLILNVKISLDSKGQLLIEILVAIMVASIIITGISNLFFVSIKEGDITEMRNDAILLAQEGMETIDSISKASWHDIYLPPDGFGSKDAKGAGSVYCVKNGGASWLLSTNLADCSVLANGKPYARKVYIYNAKRDNGNISESSGADDPSTQKIKISVSYQGGKDIESEQYITRWRNRILKQSEWSSSAPQNQIDCENINGTWEAGFSVCVASFNNPANENGWISYDNLDGGSGNLDNSGGVIKFK